MATTVSQDYGFVGEITITVGSVTGSSSKTVTSTSIPGYVDTSFVPVVIAPTLTDAGLGIGNAWFSSPTSTGTTLNIVVTNASTTKTPANDPIVFKVVTL